MVARPRTAPDPRDWIESIVSTPAHRIGQPRRFTGARHDMARPRTDLRVMGRLRRNPSASVSTSALRMALQKSVFSCATGVVGGIAQEKPIYLGGLQGHNPTAAGLVCVSVLSPAGCRKAEQAAPSPFLI